MPVNPPDFLAWAAQQTQLDPSLVDRVVQAESSGRQGAVSPRGAQGLMQLMPGTARDLGVNPQDPVENMIGGMQYLSQQRQRFGNDSQALAAYNAGPNRVAKGGPLPAETQAYVQKIMGGAQNAPPDFLDWAQAQEAHTPPTEAPTANQVKDPTQTPAEGYSFGGFVNNVVESAGNTMSGLGNAVMHPIDTVKNLATHPGDIIENLAHRIAHPINTLYNDPVGGALDVAAFIAPMAKAAGLGKVGELAELANPLALPARAAARVGEGIYSRALHPTQTAMRNAGMNAQEFARLGLDEGANISSRGAGKVERLKNAAVGERNQIIGNASEAGQTVHPMEVTQNLPQLLAKMGEDVTPEAKLAGVNDVQQEFWRKYMVPPEDPGNLVNYVPSNKKGVLMEKRPLSNPDLEGPSNMRRMSVQEAEKTKERAYEYTPQTAWTSEAVPPATREARMSLAKELKRLIEERTQGFETGGQNVQQLNSRYSKLNSLQDAIEHRLDNPNGRGLDLLKMLALEGSGLPAPLAVLAPYIMSSPTTARALYAAPGLARRAALPPALANALRQE